MGIVTEESLWDAMLSADPEHGLSVCCNAKVVIKILDGEHGWIECIACGKECEMT